MKKNEGKGAIAVILIIVLLLIIAGLCYVIYDLYNNKLDSETQINDLNGQVEKLNGKIEVYEEKMDKIEKTISKGKTEPTEEEAKKIFEKYINLIDRTYSDSSEMLKELELIDENNSISNQNEVLEMDKEKAEKLGLETNAYYKTDIEYSKFMDKILTLMTQKMFDKNLKFLVFEENGKLNYLACGGTLRIIKSAENLKLISQKNDIFEYEIYVSSYGEDHKPTQEELEPKKVTFSIVNENGNFVISEFNFED